jgi:hypothetical protein
LTKPKKNVKVRQKIKIRRIKKMSKTDELVKKYMAGGNVSYLLNKMVMENVDPKELTEAVMALDKASAVRGDQKSITDGEVIAIQTYGTLEQLKANFANKLMENGDNENVNLPEQKAKLHCMMNENKSLPLKTPKIDLVKMGMVKSGKEM